MIIAQLAQILEPWQRLYSNSKVIPTAVEAGHLLSMLTGGGLAIAADRATLRLFRDDVAQRERHLAELRDVHRPVVISVTILFVTGIALTAADIETFFASPVFWIKLGLVALLLVNGYILMRTEAKLRNLDPEVQRSARLWSAWRRGAIISMALWCATLIAGVMLVNVA